MRGESVFLSPPSLDTVHFQAKCHATGKEKRCLLHAMYSFSIGRDHQSWIKESKANIIVNYSIQCSSNSV